MLIVWRGPFDWHRAGDVSWETEGMAAVFIAHGVADPAPEGTRLPRRKSPKANHVDPDDPTGVSSPVKSGPPGARTPNDP